MNKDRELTHRAAALARAAPREWPEFLQAMQEYTDEIRNHCISSPVETLQVSQGRAQNCRDLLRLFAECQETSDQMKEKSKPK